MIPAQVPHPFEDDAERQKRLEPQLPLSTPRAALIVGGGCAALIVFAVAWHAGYPGAGAVLVPFGLLLVLLGGIELLLSRL
jgi:hypothetical protein